MDSMVTLFQNLVYEEEMRQSPWWMGGECCGVNAERQWTEYHDSYLAADGLDPV